MTASAKKHLHDVRTAALEIRTHIGDMTREAFVADRLRYAAVLWNLAIIGEAMKRLERDDPTTADRVSHAATIMSFRNRIVHGYDQIKEELVWDVVANFLPMLVSEVDALIAN